MSALVDGSGLPRADRGHRPHPEGTTDDRCVGEQRLALRAEQIETGGDQGSDRVRQRHLGAALEGDLAGALFEEAAVLQEADELLGKERVAAAALEDQGLQVGGQRPGTEASAGELGGLLAGERAEGKLSGRCNEARAGTGELEHLGSGAGQDEERGGSRASGQVVHEGQHRLVGPVQVLDDEHRGIGGSEALEELSPGGEVLLARGLLCLEAEERAQARAEPVAVGVLGQDRLEAGLGAGHAVALEHAGLGAHDLAERPEGDAAAEGQAAALTPDDEPGVVVEAAGELGQQSALADAGLADEEGTVETPVGGRLVEQGLELGELLLPADELGAEAAQLGAGARQRRGRDPGA